MERVGESQRDLFQWDCPEYRILVPPFSLPDAGDHAAAMADGLALADEVPADDGTLWIFLCRSAHNRLRRVRSCGNSAHAVHYCFGSVASIYCDRARRSSVDGPVSRDFNRRDDPGSWRAPLAGVAP